MYFNVVMYLIYQQNELLYFTLVFVLFKMYDRNKNTNKSLINF